MDNHFWHLRNHRLFKTLNNSQISDLCIITKYKQGKKGDMIFFDSHDEPRIYLLKKGKLKIVDVNENGDEIIKDIIDNGELFGELSVQSTENLATGYARVLTSEVIICSFLVKDFQVLIASHPDLALHYTSIIGLRLQRIQNRYSNLFFKDTKQRFFDLMMEWVNKASTKLDDNIIVQNYLTHSDIAGLICCTRQTATQLINDLQKDGLLSHDRKTWTLFPAFFQAQST